MLVLVILSTDLVVAKSRTVGTKLSPYPNKARFDIMEPGVVVPANLAKQVAGDHSQLPSDSFTTSPSTLISISGQDVLGRLIVNVNSACN